MGIEAVQDFTVWVRQRRTQIKFQEHETRVLSSTELYNVDCCVRLNRETQSSVRGNLVAIVRSTDQRKDSMWGKQPTT